MNNCAGIREQLANRLECEEFVIDKSGVKTIELVGTSFRANEPAIFGTPNYEYIAREIEWYKSRSLKVADIPGGTPKIWEQVSSVNGEINSNYGWATLSEANGEQWYHCRNALAKDVDTRRAIMIYTRPSMQWDYKRDGMSDFMCTNTVQYLIRDGYLQAVVNMRSNDAWAGFRNDYAWQAYVLQELCKDLHEFYPDLVPGEIWWQTGSLHVYERQFYLVHHYLQAGEHDIKKAEFREKYPDFKYSMT